MTRMTRYARLARQLSLFVAVGTMAALTHWGVAVLLVSRLTWAPALANVAGWLVAFVVSFTGHHFLTFRDALTPWSVAARRLFLISAGNFVLNEIVYITLLRSTDLPYDGLLAGILIAQAVLTFLASRYWAFRSGPHREAS
ncbi:GtrA family protein [Hylemonella gracilis]|jgi:putative flippase GtrA|uniref:GtrA family protein n=1 Tax=Hylemonella gracilis TaxID=80880 RepID=A0A4P6UJX8_9BURK|nr:GtrA family protein [Hylemonella gracilis]QBK04876.1 GtrA family protein [Hylemonella gracilis]